MDIILTILREIVPSRFQLSHFKCVESILRFLLITLSVNLMELARVMSDGCLPESSMRRIQRLLAVEIADFRRLLDACPDLERWWSAILLEQVYALERRYVWLSTSSAAERYHTFMQIRRGIVGRIPIKYIAQYLSIAPETLSRIRARK